MSEEKVQVALKAAEKAGFKLVRGSELKPFEYISCGLPQLDELGGPVLGRYIVRYGSPGSGKSTLSNRYIAWAQKTFPERLCLKVDAENKEEPAWSEAQGVDLSQLLLLQGMRTMEDYFNAVKVLVQQGNLSYVVVDSISAMTPKDVLETSEGKEKTLDNNQVAADAKKIQQFIKMTNSDFFRANTACELIAQVRTGGIGGSFTYETYSGGHMMKHMAIQVWHHERTGRADSTYEKIKVEGHDVKVLRDYTIRCTLEKDTGPDETKRAFAKFVVGVGFDDFRAQLRAAIRLGVLEETSKGRYRWTDRNAADVKIHGFDQATAYFQDNPEEYERSKALVLEAHYTDNPVAREDTEEA